MNVRRQRDDFYSRIFGYGEEGVEVRLRWRFILGLLTWVLLSGFAMVLTIFIPQTPQHKIVIVALSFVKYVPVIWVAYSVAKESAARYLDDIFELEDDTIAQDFIEEVAFGYGHDSITINEGKISEIDEHSPIILIGRRRGKSAARPARPSVVKERERQGVTSSLPTTPRWM